MYHMHISTYVCITRVCFTYCMYVCMHACTYARMHGCAYYVCIHVCMFSCSDGHDHHVVFCVAGSTALSSHRFVTTVHPMHNPGRSKAGYDSERLSPRSRSCDPCVSFSQVSGVASRAASQAGQLSGRVSDSVMKISAPELQLGQAAEAARSTLARFSESALGSFGGDGGACVKTQGSRIVDF